ncbi:MAG: hypothetical protein Q6373_016235 [Candidatus Sigynarchaeota archaeon]
MSQGILLAFRSQQYPVACVPVAKRTSRTLRDALKLFSGKYYAQFGDKLVTTSKVSKFAPASAIVTECFHHRQRWSGYKRRPGFRSRPSSRGWSAMMARLFAFQAGLDFIG